MRNNGPICNWVKGTVNTETTPVWKKNKKSSCMYCAQDLLLTSWKKNDSFDLLSCAAPRELLSVQTVNDTAAPDSPPAGSGSRMSHTKQPINSAQIVLSM